MQINIDEKFNYLMAELDNLSNKVKVLLEHVSNTSNPHSVSNSQVGLNNLTNVSQAAIDASNLSTENIINWQQKCNFERVETLYDKDVLDSSINWGYTGGIQGNKIITGKDFNKYKMLRVYVVTYVGQAVTHIDLQKTIARSVMGDYYYFAGQVIAAPDGVNDIYKSVMAVNSNKTAFKHQYVGYSNYTQYISRDTNSDYYIYKIEGIF